jgi:hypothetical protein
MSSCHELSEPKDSKQMLVVLVLVMVMDDCGNVFTIEKSNLGEYLEQIKKYKTPNHMCLKSGGNALT